MIEFFRHENTLIKTLRFTSYQNLLILLIFNFFRNHLFLCFTRIGIIAKCVNVQLPLRTLSDIHTLLLDKCISRIHM